MIPEVWTPEDERRHLEDCDFVVDVSSFGEAEPRPMCACGEASRHTPLAVARAEVDLIAPVVR